MTKPAERRHRSITIAIGRRIGVDHGDYCEALARANAYTEASNPS